MCIMLDSMYVTMSISTGFYPNLDLWNANKLHYITLWIAQCGKISISQSGEVYEDGRQMQRELQK